MLSKRGHLSLSSIPWALNIIDRRGAISRRARELSLEDIGIDLKFKEKSLSATKKSQASIPQVYQSLLF